MISTFEDGVDNLSRNNYELSLVSLIGASLLMFALS